MKNFIILDMKSVPFLRAAHRVVQSNAVLSIQMDREWHGVQWTPSKFFRTKKLTLSYSTLKHNRLTSAWP